MRKPNRGFLNLYDEAFSGQAPGSGSFRDRAQDFRDRDDGRPNADP